MNTTLVLEIGNPWLKMVALRSGQVRALSAVNVASASEDTIAKAIADFLAELKVKKPQSITVSFSRNAVTLRNLRIPSVNASEIDDMIKLHVGRQVPYAKEEIVSGYRVIGKDAMGYAKVMLAIVHRESIRKVFRILEKAALYTDRVELSSDGVLSWLSRSARFSDLKPGDGFIILDADSNFTDFIVSTTENIVFSRVITSGAEQLADESKWPKFVGEIKQTIVISQGEEVLQKPAKIYFSGAIEKIRKLAALVETEINLPVQVVEPVANIPLSKEIVKKPAQLFEAVSVSSLLGLGLETTKKKINFVLPEAQIRKTLRERSRDMIFFASAAMYIVLITCGLYLEKMHNKESQLALLKARYAKISEDSEGLNEKVERVKRIKAKLDTKAAAINYLLEVSKLLPPEIVVTSLNFQKDEKLDLKGRTREMSDVFKFITTLEVSPFFQDVQTRYTTRKKVKGEDMNEFELICPVESGGKSKKAKKSRG